ncbi:MAG: TadE family protein [bacterium]|jgi:Flp pilus assembly protein TadG|nr:pilus assembly protein [Bacillota bacterium]
MQFWLRRLKKDTRGQTMVEFALIAPVLLLILMGMFDFGRVFHAYVTVSTVARETARYAIVRHSEKEVFDKAEESAVGLNSTKLNFDVVCAGTNKNYVISTPGSLDDTDAPWNSEPFGTQLKVTANYSCELLTPLMVSVIGANSVSMSSKVVMALE